MRLATLSLPILLVLSISDYPKYVVPNVADLTIRTRQIFSESHSVETISYFFKGARSRQERSWQSPNVANNPLLVWITQCDAERTLLLNPGANTYAYMAIPRDLGGTRMPAVGARRVAEEPDGSEIPVTIDAEDTGERRQMGGLTARHVVTTTRTGPGGGDTTTHTTVQDGWYVDLPPTDCFDRGDQTWVATELTLAPSRPPRYHVTRLGTGRKGFPIIETHLDVNAAPALTSSIELVDVNNRPLDPALFDVPAGYRPALRRWGSDFDLTRPDTLFNRATVVWEAASGWVHWLLR